VDDFDYIARAGFDVRILPVPAGCATVRVIATRGILFLAGEAETVAQSAALIALAIRKWEGGEYVELVTSDHSIAPKESTFVYETRQDCPAPTIHRIDTGHHGIIGRASEAFRGFDFG
jgi:hypothetical protein